MKSKQIFGKTLFAAAMMTGILSAFTVTAHADEWRDHERMAHEWHEHEWHEHERMVQEWHHRHHWHEHDYYRPVVVEQPEFFYAPPFVVEAPEAESSGGSSLNITIPLNF